MLPRNHPFRRAQRRRAATAARAGGFFPTQVSGVSAWLRLPASTAVSSEWETVVDALNSNPATQTSANRKPAAATSANGLPIATFDGSDMWVWPVAASNHSTTAWELLLWIKPASVAANQRVFACDTSSGASVNRIRVGLNASGGAQALIFITNADGRQFDTPNSVLTAGAWTFLRLAYDSAKTAEADLDGLTTDAKVRIFINGTAQALTGSNVGAGGTIGALRTATGNNVIGAANDADAPVQPLTNGAQTGPNVYVANTALTAAQASNLQGFEQPT